MQCPRLCLRPLSDPLTLTTTNWTPSPHCYASGHLHIPCYAAPVFSPPRERLAGTRLRQGNKVTSLPMQRVVILLKLSQRFLTCVPEPQPFVKVYIPGPQRFVNQVLQP